MNVVYDDRWLNAAAWPLVDNRGKTHTKETKRKISETMKGEKSHMYGKTFSEEHKGKLSEAKKGENHHMYGKNPLKRSQKKNISGNEGQNPLGIRAKLFLILLKLEEKCLSHGRAKLILLKLEEKCLRHIRARPLGIRAKVIQKKPKRAMERLPL